jgi:ribosomal 50S subunit-recycling heat shock protein
MRLDLFLKASRLVTRRSVAKELCDAGRIKVNALVARASKEVKIGDAVELQRGARVTKVRILDLPSSKQVRRDQAAELFEVIDEARHADQLFS